MNGADRSVHVLGLAVPPTRRARFVEEWQADLAAARALGLDPAQLLLAAARVAAFLLRIRMRTWLLRRHGRGELLAEGILLGFALVIVDAQLAALVPFVLLAVGWRLWRAVRAWIDGGT